jgi:cobalamin biosynthesis Co2+ chelatase CbiK
MHNIDHLKRLIGAELEALVSEVNELKKRVAELEQGPPMRALYSKEHLGQWIDKKIDERSMITCNTSEIV